MPGPRITDTNHWRVSWLENLDAADPYVRLAIKEIFRVYGDRVSVDDRAGSLLKFGETAIAGGSTQVLIGNLSTAILLENYSTSNSITHVASSSTAVVGSAVIQGHTIDANGNFTPVSQTVTLAGQTKTALTTPLARAQRLYNDSTTSWNADVYVAEDVAFTTGIPATGVHLIGEGTENQSLKAASCVSSTEYFLLGSVYADIKSRVANTADIRLKMRLKGKTFRTQWNVALDTATQRQVEINFRPFLIVPKNSDIELTAASTAAANNVSVVGHYSGVYADVR